MPLSAFPSGYGSQCGWKSWRDSDRDAALRITHLCFLGFRTRCTACSAMPFTRQAVPVPGPWGLCCMHLYGFHRTRHRSEWDSNPRTRGMDPLLYHLAILQLRWMPFACKAHLRPVPKASRLMAIAVCAFLSTRHIFMHAGVEPAVPRPETGCFPVKRMHRKKLLSVSLQSTA